jgi:hypothetical protein
MENGTSLKPNNFLYANLTKDKNRFLFRKAGGLVGIYWFTVDELKGLRKP